MTMMTETTATSLRTHQHAVEQFLYEEANILDRKEFPAWLKLFTQDCIYWIPSGFDDLDPSRSVSIVYDNYDRLSERAWRFEGGLAYAQQPSSRTSRLVSNVLVTAVDDSDPAGAVIHAEAKFITTEFRRQTLLTYAGRFVYQLVETEDGLRIRQKKVQLLNNDGHLGNLSLPL